MFSKILVPLDGSELSERALQPAVHIAKKVYAEIVLLRVMVLDLATIGGGMSPHNYELRQLYERNDRLEAESYLQTIETEWHGAGVVMHARVATGAPPEMILQAAEESGADLIVMSTHGRTGLNRLLYGSVAEAVLRGTPLPVLLIPVK